MSTHFVPGIGHKTYKETDTIPSGAVPRPVVDLGSHTIIQSASGFEVIAIPAEELQLVQDIKDIKSKKPLTLVERIDRLERMFNKLIGE